MKLSAIIIGIMLVGAMMTGLYHFVNEMAGDQGGYNVEFDNSYESAFDKSQNISSEMSDDYQEIMNFTVDKGSTIGIVTLIPDVLSLMKNTITLPLTIAQGMIQSIITYLQLPDWTYVLMMTMFSILVIFGFIALVLRFRYV